jgi:diguanylate cyclase (GGDEF)-like protein
MNETSLLKENDLKSEYSKSRNIKSAMVVPLKSKEKLVGVIYLEHNKEDYFNDDNIRYINTLAIAIRLSLENAQLYSKLEEMALRDGLTGLYNRMFFNKEIQNCMENYRRFGLPFILTIFDFDRFKNINDTYGHICGDKVLTEISDMIKMEIRKDDILCRYGGEEFAIIFRNTSDISSIMTRLEILREKIENTYIDYEDNRVQITCSFGVVSCVSVDKSGTPEQVIKNADEALYEAKNTGRNKICIYK